MIYRRQIAVIREPCNHSVNFYGITFIIGIECVTPYSLSLNGQIIETASDKMHSRVPAKLAPRIANYIRIKQPTL